MWLDLQPQRRSFCISSTADTQSRAGDAIKTTNKTRADARELAAPFGQADKLSYLALLRQPPGVNHCTDSAASFARVAPVLLRCLFQGPRARGRLHPYYCAGTELRRQQCHCEEAPK